MGCGGSGAAGRVRAGGGRLSRDTDADACSRGYGDAYVNSVIGNASTATVRTSLPAQPPTPVPTAVPTAMPVPVAQAFAAAETTPTATPMPTATAEPQTVEPFAPVTQASAGDDGTGGIDRIILAAIGVPMLIGALIVILLMRRERQRRNGYHGLIICKAARALRRPEQREWGVA